MKKKRLLMLLFFVLLTTVGCKNVNEKFDEYIRNQGFDSQRDVIKNGNEACVSARKKGYDCEMTSYPEHDTYYNSKKDLVVYTSEEGVHLMGENYAYLPLKHTFYYGTNDPDNGIEYNTKTGECTKAPKNECSSDDLKEVKKLYEKKGPILDDFKGKLEKVVF